MREKEKKEVADSPAFFVADSSYPMVLVFCERLGWHDIESLVSMFYNPVSFGVRAEIDELTTIPYIKGSRARALYKGGVRTPQAIAEASIPEIGKTIFESAL